MWCRRLLLVGVLVGCSGKGMTDSAPSSGGAGSDGAVGGDGSDGGAGGDGADGSDGGGGDEPVDAVLGQVCAPEERLGRVSLVSWGSGHSLDATVTDIPHPWISAPVATTETCAFHQWESAECGGCATDELCTASGCEPAPVADRSTSLVVNAGGGDQSFAADAATGQLYGTVDVTGSTVSFALDWDDHRVRAELPVVVDVPAVQVTLTGDSMAPGDLAASWTPMAEGTVTTTIPINHHAGGPTFVACMAPGSAGAFTATAAMVDPLAVVTGLEFQTVSVGSVAAAVLPSGGCVEFEVVTAIFPDMVFEGE